MKSSTSFAKGYIPWNKGKAGYTNRGSIKKGQKFSLETRAKMSASKKGKIPHPVTQQMKEKIRQAKLGKKHSAETRKRMSNSHPKGDLSPNWVKDRSKIKSNKDRHWGSYEYTNWRNMVFTRDAYKCRISEGNCETYVEAHHILSWRDYPELRYKVNNGITLCRAHHPRKRAEEKRLVPVFQELVSVSKKHLFHV